MTTTPPRRALIVIDVQNEYVTGDLPIEYPDVGLSLRNIGRAIDAAHAQRIPVVVVQNTAPAGAPIFVKDKAVPRQRAARSMRLTSGHV
ncbi:MAG TPA: isochorismatase family protein [Polyangiales bacterium]|nr:isochorismatase family protein [Polyangiales bacterium]